MGCEGAPEGDNRSESVSVLAVVRLTLEECRVCRGADRCLVSELVIDEEPELGAYVLGEGPGEQGAGRHRVAGGVGAEIDPDSRWPRAGPEPRAHRSSRGSRHDGLSAHRTSHGVATPGLPGCRGDPGQTVRKGLPDGGGTVTPKPIVAAVPDGETGAGIPPAVGSLSSEYVEVP